MQQTDSYQVVGGEFGKNPEANGADRCQKYERLHQEDGNRWIYIRTDFTELLELIKLLRIDSNNINQIDKAANTCGTVDEKTISIMKADHIYHRTAGRYR